MRGKPTRAACGELCEGHMDDLRALPPRLLLRVDRMSVFPQV